LPPLLLGEFLKGPHVLKGHLLLKHHISILSISSLALAAGGGRW
jgi:hypothetical protein